MLIDRLNEDMKSSMKERDTLKTQVLRMVLSDCKYARVEKRADLTDEEVLQVLKRAIKSREDSETQYRQANRPDLADKESAEIAVVRAYLPEPLPQAELEAIVDEAIRETGASSVKDMGRVMKSVLSVHAARVDGKALQALVSSRLNPA